MDYLDRIKQVKSEKKITNDALSESTGIPLGTLSKILAGISDSPKFVNIIAICEALGCDINYIVTGEPENKNNYTLNEKEIAFIELYRSLDSHGKELVGLVAEKESERAASDKSAEGYDVKNGDKSSKIYSGSKFMPYIVDADVLQSQQQRVRYTGAEAVPLKRRITLYEMPVSAGCGIFLDDDSATEITIPDNAKSRDADFAVRISGNSMEPKFRNGDYLLVRNTESVEVGEVGVFVLDGEGYVKVYNGDRLLSLNSAYSPILLKEFENVRCVGAVIGKLKKK